MFLTLLLFCIFPFCGVYWAVSKAQVANALSQQKVAKEQQQVLLDSALLGLKVGSTQAWATVQASYTATPVPSSTPLPTDTPLPTSTPNMYPILVFKLSFYDPHIGAYFPEVKYVNCLDWDDSINDCVSRVNNGLDDYRTWYRRGVACGSPLRIGQKINVVNVSELARFNPWTCIDRGGAVTSEYLDFMLEYPNDVWTGNDINQFPWNQSIEVEVLP